MTYSIETIRAEFARADREIADGVARQAARTLAAQAAPGYAALRQADARLAAAEAARDRADREIRSKLGGLSPELQKVEYERAMRLHNETVQAATEQVRVVELAVGRSLQTAGRRAELEREIAILKQQHERQLGPLLAELSRLS